MGLIWKTGLEITGSYTGAKVRSLYIEGHKNPLGSLEIGTQPHLGVIRKPEACEGSGLRWPPYLVSARNQNKKDW